VLMLTHVNYRSGRLWDLADITARAHAAGAVMLWDLAHSTGAMPIDLVGAHVDLAVGCGYKYLNGGPGAPGFLYVAERYHQRINTPLSGWFGHASPFSFEAAYRPAADITRFAVGTPPVISLAALEVGVDLMLEAPMAALRLKSLRLGQLFADLVEQELAGHGFAIASPRADSQRGSQICLTHANAWPITQALIARGVIGDFRTPNILRFGFAPLYNRYTDIWRAVVTLKDVMENQSWKDPHYESRSTVT